MKLIIKKNPLTKVFGLYMILESKLTEGLAVRFNANYARIRSCKNTWADLTERTLRYEHDHILRCQGVYPNEPMTLVIETAKHSVKDRLFTPYFESLIYDSLYRYGGDSLDYEDD